MKAAIYDPYLDTLGGGERYLVGVAKVLRDNGYDVEIKWKSADIIKSLEKRFDIGLENIKIVGDIKKGDGYDLCFWFSDGSIPLLHARNNILHFQVPFTKVGGRSLLNKMKLYRINTIVVNSNFTKRFIDKEYGVDSKVVYPPVDVSSFSPHKKKRNVILSVGRFSQLKQSKKQHVLIRVFKKMCDEGLVGWKLVFAGGAEIGAKEYLVNLKKNIEGYPIEIVESPNFKKLVNLYGAAKIFWTACGHGVDEEKNPEKVEHFGITLVEAIASGCVPFAYGAGGFSEILRNNPDNLWNTKKELTEKTLRAIGNMEQFTVRKKLVEEFNHKSFDKNFSRYI